MDASELTTSYRLRRLSKSEADLDDFRSQSQLETQPAWTILEVRNSAGQVCFEAADFAFGPPMGGVRYSTS